MQKYLQAAFPSLKAACFWCAIKTLLLRLVSDSACWASLEVCPSLLQRILLQRIRRRDKRTERHTERNELTFWLRCQQILFTVSKCLLRISHWTLEVRRDRYSVETSAVRHRSSLDYTSDAATVHGQDKRYKLWNTNRWRLHLPGRLAMHLMVEFNVQFKLPQRSTAYKAWSWDTIDLV